MDPAPIVTLDDLYLIVPNKFELVMIAAKRARQIKDKIPKLVVTESVNPVTIALEELAAGKIYIEGDHVKVVDEYQHLVIEKAEDLDLLGDAQPVDADDEVDAGGDAMDRLLAAMGSSGLQDPSDADLEAIEGAAAGSIKEPAEKTTKDIPAF